MSATNRLKALLLLSILLSLIVIFLGVLLFLLPPSGEAPLEEAPESAEVPAEEDAEEPGPRAPEGVEEEPGETAEAGEEAGAAIPEERYRIYLVVDDAGHDPADLEPYLSLPVPLTVAILPDRRASKEALQAARLAGVESILHLPMEPTGVANPGAGALLTSQTDEEIAALLRSHLRSLPGVIGVNNHMGSLATTDPRVMDVVMSTLAEEGLFFLDSRTTPLSVAAAAAEARDVPYAERTVFLDNERSRDAVAVQLDEAARLAEKEGYAVVIGHVTSPVVARVVTERYEAYRDRGIAFYPLSALF
ncbi:MAG: divergent polysaccharide deacetylase family protein [Spirochaetaceae bacterium]